MLKILAILFFSFVLLPTASYGTPLSEKQGNIYYDRQQLTSSGKDSQPVLSPDGKSIAFVREVEKPNTELWLMDASGLNAHRILQSHEHEEVKQNLTGFNNPVFSLNGKTVYFLTSAWVTSDAVHVIDLTTNNQHFVTDGNSLEIIPSGKYKGYMIVSKHKYYKKSAGSYEDFCLVSPKGKEIKSLGEARKQVDAFIRAH